MPNLNTFNFITNNFEKASVLLQFIESIYINVDNTLWLFNNLNFLKDLHNKYNNIFYTIDKYSETIYNKDISIKINDNYH